MSDGAWEVRLLTQTIQFPTGSLIKNVIFRMSSFWFLKYRSDLKNCLILFERKFLMLKELTLKDPNYVCTYVYIYSRKQNNNVSSIMVYEKDT